MDVLEQEIVSGSGIRWAMQVCTPCRQPHQHPTTLFFTGRMPLLTPNQQRQSTEGSLLTQDTCIIQIINWVCSQLFTWNSVLQFHTTHPSNHSHLCVLKFHLIFLSYWPGLTSMQHTTSHTTTVQYPSHFQWSILTDKQWYPLPEFIPSNSDSIPKIIYYYIKSLATVIWNSLQTASLLCMHSFLQNRKVLLHWLIQQCLKEFICWF